MSTLILVEVVVGLNRKTGRNQHKKTGITQINKNASSAVKMSLTHPAIKIRHYPFLCAAIILREEVTEEYEKSMPNVELQLRKTVAHKFQFTLFNCREFMAGAEVKHFQRSCS